MSAVSGQGATPARKSKRLAESLAAAIIAPQTARKDSSKMDPAFGARSTDILTGFARCGSRMSTRDAPNIIPPQESGSASTRTIPPKRAKPPGGAFDN